MRTRITHNTVTYVRILPREIELENHITRSRSFALCLTKQLNYRIDKKTEMFRLYGYFNFVGRTAGCIVSKYCFTNMFIFLTVNFASLQKSTHCMVTRL